MAHTSAYYPNWIMQPEFRDRRIIISVKKPQGEETALAAYNKALALGKEIYSSAAEKAGTSFSDKVQNIKETQMGKNSNAPISSITLPLPNVFSDNQRHEWNPQRGLLGTIGDDLVNRSIASPVQGVIAKALPGKIGAAISAPLNAAGSITIDKGIGMAANAGGFRKPIIDPGYFQNYTGSTPRTFSMSFDFIPANVIEANQIFNIIMMFKEYGSPSRMIGGVSLWAPYTFDIEFGNSNISAIAGIKNLAMSSITLDYGADGAMQQFADGTPKFISMALEFQETRLTTANDYTDKPMAGQGYK